MLSRSVISPFFGAESAIRSARLRATASANRYRTKRVILDIYDEMAAAARAGVPYVTRLDPPPADPRVAHPDTRMQAT